MGQWSRLCASTEGDVSSIPVQGTKIPHAKPHSQKKEKRIKLISFLTIYLQKNVHCALCMADSTKHDTFLLGRFSINID